MPGLHILSTICKTAEDVFLQPVPQKNEADLAVRVLSLMAFEDLKEILILCGGGFGLRGLKILRSLYERVVTLAYLSKYPEEAKAYLDYGYISLGKELHHLRAAGAGTGLSQEQIDEAERNYKEMLPHYQKRCKKCGKEETMMSWTQLDTVMMAAKAGYDLAKLYLCFYHGTLQLHPTALGIANMHKVENGQALYDETVAQEGWVKLVLTAAPALFITALEAYNAYFKLSFKSKLEIQKYTFFTSISDQQVGHVRNPVQESSGSAAPPDV